MSANNPPFEETENAPDVKRYSGSTPRVSMPPGMEMVSLGGLGFFPRRGISALRADQVGTLDGIMRLGRYNPLELLQMLPDIVAEPSLAAWNMLRLANIGESIRFKCMTKSKPNRQETTLQPALKKQKPDIDGKYPAREVTSGTAILTEFFKNLPDEVGGLVGAVSQNMQMILFTGMACCEFVPLAGPKQTGELWPLQTLTLFFKREEDASLGLYQRQIPFRKVTTGGANTPTYDRNNPRNMTALPLNRTFWAALDVIPGNPYGRAPFAPALNEILVNLAFMRDLTLAWHRVGTPKYDVGFDFEMWASLAETLTEYDTPEEINRWVQKKFKEAKSLFDSLDADSAFFHDIKSKVDVAGSGGHWPDVPGIYNIYRWRVITALKQLPTLFGVSDGKTETWSTVEWRIFKNGLTDVIRAACYPILKALQVLITNVYGLPYEVVLELDEPEANQRLTEAESEELEIQNETAKVTQGWITNDEAAVTITGSPAVAEPERMATPAPGDGPQPVAPVKPKQGPEAAYVAARNAVITRAQYHAKVKDRAERFERESVPA